MGWGKAKEKEINTPMYIGKIHIQRIYLDKIYKKKSKTNAFCKSYSRILSLDEQKLSTYEQVEISNIDS